MKTIKITIVAIFLIALGFGLYKVITQDSIPGPNPNPVMYIPEECDLDWDQKYIDSVYRSIPTGQFLTLKTRRIEMTANYSKIMEGAPQKCKETVDLILRNRYQSRFIDMTNGEFEGKNWPNYSVIRDMNKALLNELTQGSSELKKIDKICNEYGLVISYNSKVRGQSNQRPFSISDHWNFSNTRNLINSTPSASAPVDHTTQYETSRQGNVKEILYKGHVAFLNKLVELARQRILDENTESNYNRVFDTVTKEIDEFKTKAESHYSKGYSSVNSTAERLISTMKSYEKLLN